MFPPNYDEMLYSRFPVVLTTEDRAAFSMSLMTGTNYNYPVPDNGQVAQMLREVGDRVVDGDLSDIKRMLACQITALDQMYHRMIHRAIQIEGDSIDTYDRFMRLALRAQTLSVRTAATLAKMAGPPAKAQVKEAAPTSKTEEKPTKKDEAPKAQLPEHPQGLRLMPDYKPQMKDGNEVESAEAPRRTQPLTVA